MPDQTTQISTADDTGNPIVDAFRALADIPLVIFTGHSIYEPDDLGDDR